MGAMERGSEEWTFFEEYWKFRKKYHDAENTEEWFTEMMSVGEKIMEKYQNTDFSQYAKRLVFDHFEDVENRYKERLAHEQHT